METLFIGKNIIKLSEVDSTNNYANKLLRQSVINEGDVVITNSQIAGRGQRENVWISEKDKNLTFSVLLSPKFLTVDEQFYLTKAISIAIVRVLNQYVDEQVEIKWPNDIYVSGSKIAGILIENMISGNKISNSIVGVGLNVNQSVFGNLTKVTSLINMINTETDLSELLSKIFYAIEFYYLKLRKNIKSLDEEYLSLLMGINKTQSFMVGNEKKLGKIEGVNKRGQLLVDFDGKISEFNMKEIVFL